MQDLLGGDLGRVVAVRSYPHASRDGGGRFVHFVRFVRFVRFRQLFIDHFIQEV